MWKPLETEIEVVAGPLDYQVRWGTQQTEDKKLAPGIDNILIEWSSKNQEDFHKRLLINLFNRILNTGKYPIRWSIGLIVSI